MPQQNSKIVRQFLPLVMAVAMALPGGSFTCCGSCGTCQGCAAAVQKTAKDAPHCQQAGGCCKQAKSCRDKTAAAKSGQAGKAPCFCGCQSSQPADRPVNSISNVADEHFALVVTFADLPVGQSDRARLEVASSPGAVAPEIPHRILHCSWLN